MKKSLIRAAGVVALGLMCLHTNAQTLGDTVPDFGSVTGSTYANKYFGLTLTIPKGWVVQDSSVKKEISDKGKELVTTDDPVKQRQIDKAVDSALNLVTIAERPLGEPGPFNATFIGGAEKVPPGGMTDAGYILVLKNTLKYVKLPITIERDVYTEQIGGVAFSSVDLKTNFPGMIVNQKYYAHVVKNYILFFIVSYQTPDQLKTLTETLRSVMLQ